MVIAKRGIWLAAFVVLFLHGALLAAAIPDYRVTIDSAYHVALARYYGEHGTAWWDRINFGPAGRPNLQGPLLHFTNGILGRVLGGTGRDYVIAGAILAVVQWAAAMGTAGFFALQLGGEWAMLFAVSLLSGAAFAATSFAVGIPSGWLFILTPWAIYFFLRDRLAAATLTTAAAIYVHIAGYVTTPFGLLIAALGQRRWRALAIVGSAAFILTLPYTVHIVRYFGWFSGEHSRAALLFDPMLDVLAVAGFLELLRRPRRHAFLFAWTLAPLAWVFQDPSRLILQEALAGSVIAALLVADLLGRIRPRRWFIAAATAFIMAATLAPLGVPSLASEGLWDAGLRFPRAIDWTRARALADTIRQAGLEHRLVADYMPALCPALAVYQPLSCEQGHWVEVAPPIDPADALSAGVKVYVLPLPPDDPVLAALAARGWVHVYGGINDTTVATLNQRPDLAAVAPVVAETIARASAWLGTNAINNSLTLADAGSLLRKRERFFRERRQRLDEQRVEAGRLELAFVLYAYGLEQSRPAQARQMRKAARGFGVIAGFLSDEMALDFQSASHHRRLKTNFAKLAAVAGQLKRQPAGGPDFLAVVARLLDQYFANHEATLALRSPRDRFPYIGDR